MCGKGKNKVNTNEIKTNRSRGWLKIQKVNKPEEKDFVQK